ncbi:MAG: hypothetical protein C0591_08415 [Marinilabiliales bacterium]|nr:MAG: hypothetical protein C0591_08415 [Marinilabiliales bacterium]
MKNLLLVSFMVFLLIILAVPIFCQEHEEIKKENNSWLSLEFNADLVSRYIWRGGQYNGSSPNIQPNIALNMGNFQIGSWSSYSLGGVNFISEFDWYLNYTFLKGMFTVQVTDYFFPNDTVNYNQFEYTEQRTGHVLEGMLTFNGTEKIPLSFLIAVNFYGADAAKIDDDPSSSDFNQKIGIQYSTYAELIYSTNIKSIGFDAFLGLNLTKPKPADPSTGYVGETGYYGDKIGVVNLGIKASKGIPISSKYELPISITLISNPMAKKIYGVFAINF